MFISKIKEAKKKTTFDTPIDQLKTPDILSRIDSPIATVEPDSTAEPGSTAEPEKKEFKKASQSDTLRATAGITPTDRMRDLMSRMRDLEGDEDEGYPEPEPPGTEVAQVTTQNLPAVAEKALARADIVTPTFHQVANLPGNMSRAIRQMGKQLFRIFTTTPTDQIYMIGNVMGMGPNSGREVNAVAGYLKDKGTDIGLGDIDFNDIIPGYTADIYQYTANGIRWLLVRDEFGQYIYTWPENTSVEHRNVKQLGTDR